MFLLSLLVLECLFDYLLAMTGGTEGLFAQTTLEITEDIELTYRNQGIILSSLLDFGK